MNNCLTHTKEISDRKEKIQDWEIFSDLLLATWIRIFVDENVAANRVAQQVLKMRGLIIINMLIHMQKPFGSHPKGRGY